MKRFVLIMMGAVLGIAFTSCQKEEVEVCVVNDAFHNPVQIEFIPTETYTDTAWVYSSHFTGWYAIEVEEGKWVKVYSEDVLNNQYKDLIDEEVCYTESETLDYNPYVYEEQREKEPIITDTRTNQ